MCGAGNDFVVIFPEFLADGPRPTSSVRFLSFFYHPPHFDHLKQWVRLFIIIMNLNENIHRIKEVMGLVVEQGSKYGFWDSVIDTFLPGTPVKDGRALLSEFDKIIERRIDFNKKNNLPIDTLTDEEKKFREKIFKATPNLNYPTVFGLSKMLYDIKSGKNVRPEEIKKYTDPSFLSITPSVDRDVANQLLDRREELKKMWLGIDNPDGDKSGFWVKSEFRPSSSKNPNDVYYKPKNLPRLSQQQFDELYNLIMTTKKTDGTFPGGNSEKIIEDVMSGKFKNLNINLIQGLVGDVAGSFHSMLGNFKFGAGLDGTKKYISIYDEWDMAPPSMKKFGVDVQKYGKTPLIYYRIYRT